MEVCDECGFAGTVCDGCERCFDCGCACNVDDEGIYEFDDE